MNYDACEYFSVHFRSGNLMRSMDGCSEDEVSVFGGIDFVSIVASISYLAASIFLTTLLLTLIFLRLSWNGVVSE